MAGNVLPLTNDVTLEEAKTPDGAAVQLSSEVDGGGDSCSPELSFLQKGLLFIIATVGAVLSIHAREVKVAFKDDEESSSIEQESPPETSSSHANFFHTLFARSDDDTVRNLYAIVTWLILYTAILMVLLLANTLSHVWRCGCTDLSEDHVEDYQLTTTSGMVVAAFLLSLLIIGAFARAAGRSLSPHRFLSPHRPAGEVEEEAEEGESHPVHVRIFKRISPSAPPAASGGVTVEERHVSDGGGGGGDVDLLSFLGFVALAVAAFWCVCCCACCSRMVSRRRGRYDDSKTTGTGGEDRSFDRSQGKVMQQEYCTCT